MKIKELSKNNRPREKLLSEGAESLSNEELLAILLRVGTKELSAIELAAKVINELGDINKMASISLSELCKIKGIKLSKGTILISAFELTKRALSFQPNTRRYNDARAVYELLNPLLSLEMEEVFYVLFVNCKCQLIEKRIFGRGDDSKILVNIKPVLKHALKIGAFGIILSHNHPSGDLMPSKSDIEITNNFVEASNLIDVLILDHVIIGNNRYFSFIEEHII